MPRRPSEGRANPLGPGVCSPRLAARMNSAGRWNEAQSAIVHH